MKAGKQGGFTLVELVVVIVILGILAATAIPKYASYTREARISALNGVAGAVRSAAAGIGNAVNAQGMTATTPGPYQWDFPTAVANCNVQYSIPGAAPFWAVTVNTAGC